MNRRLKQHPDNGSATRQRAQAARGSQNEHPHDPEVMRVRDRGCGAILGARLTRVLTVVLPELCDHCCHELDGARLGELGRRVT